MLRLVSSPIKEDSVLPFAQIAVGKKKLEEFSTFNMFSVHHTLYLLGCFNGRSYDYPHLINRGGVFK